MILNQMSTMKIATKLHLNSTISPILREKHGKHIRGALYPYKDMTNKAQVIELSSGRQSIRSVVEDFFEGINPCTASILLLCKDISPLNRKEN